jgi:hypothetical protein
MSFRSIVSVLCGGALALAATTGAFAQGASEYGSSTTAPAAGSTAPAGAGQVKKTPKVKTAKKKTGASAKAKQGQ